MRFFLFVAMIMSCGCGAITGEERLKLLGPPIEVEAEPWLMDAFDRAMGFWLRQKVKLAGYEPGGVDMIAVPFTQMEDPHHIGEYKCERKVIRIASGLESDPREAVCVVAHEIGHSLGMRHVYEGKFNVGDLMDSAEAPDPFGDCFWSERDEKELQRVIQESPTCG